MVRLPGGAVEQLRNLQAAMERRDRAGLGYDLSDVAEEVGIDKTRAQLLLSHRGIVSIDQPDDDGLRVADRLPNQKPGGDPHANTQLREEIYQLKEAFDRILDEREQYILTEHYGLDTNIPRTMADIGKTMGLSRERVRQIECAALKRLRVSI
jgi:RNA polymerase sigma factor (sigma-70 family)